MSKRLSYYVMRFIYVFRKYGGKEALKQLVNFLKWHCPKLQRPIRLRSGTVELIPGLSIGKPTALQKARALLRAPLDKKISIQGHYACMHGADMDFSGTMTVVVAHWDPQRRVDPYVAHLCRHFKSLGWKVILSSADPLSEAALPAPWTEWADAIMYRTCPGYDFTSWKAALACFPSLLRCKELVLCNDSFFGPVGSFLPVHIRMESVACDFWGMAESQQICPHIQSYYMTFRSTALQCAAFAAFFDAVPLCKDRELAIRFETSLALWLGIHGLHAAAFCTLPSRSYSNVNLSIHKWRELIKFGVPLIKRERLQLKQGECGRIDDWHALLQGKGYPVELLEQYFWRIGQDISSAKCDGQRYPSFPPDVFSLQQSVDLTVCSPTTEIPPVAVALHCFYPDLLAGMLPYLDTIPRNAHVYVSTDTQEKKEMIFATLVPFGFAALEVRLFPNRGWDLAPFLVGLRDVLPRYALVLKIHTKASIQYVAGLGQQWRRIMYSSLMGSSERVLRICNFFEKNPQLGILAPVHPPFINNTRQGLNHADMKKLLATKGISLPAKAAIDFPAGSMFWARTKALQPWLDANFSFESFEDSAHSPKDGTLAHALERLFFFGCGMQGMTWGRLAPDGFDVLHPMLHASEGKGK